MNLNINIYIENFLNILLPRRCVSCGNYLFKNEKNICMNCIRKIPSPDITNDYNVVKDRFAGKFLIQTASSLFLYDKNSKYSYLLYSLKYHGRKDLALFFGTLLVQKLPKGFFNSVDCIVPVPLHSKRFQERGYNQAEQFANGISKLINKPVITNLLIRNVYTNTQTKKSRHDRWKNVEGKFSLNKNLNLFPKHILLVDDVITTGSTMEACLYELSKIDNIQFSVASIAIA